MEKGENMKKTLASLVILTFLFCFGKTGLAQEPVSLNLGADVGYLTGYSLYHITFPINEPANGFFITDGESELEFPLDSTVGGVSASLDQKGVWSIDLSLSKNITEKTGKMKDSDWITFRDLSTGEIERGLIIYSESDTDMDALFLDISGRYYLLKKVKTSLGIIIGYRYQNLSFDISNLDQIDTLGGHDFIPGKVATYEVIYNIPYGGMAFDIRPSSKFSLNFIGTYGLASADDKDDHILRSKRSTSESDGPFYSFKAKGNLSLSQRLSVQVALEYLKIETDGKQTQTWYATTREAPAGTTISDIDYRAESEQLYLWAGIRYIF